MKKAAILLLALFALATTSRAQSQPIATISESWQLGGHPQSQSACTSNHFNCAIDFVPDGFMYDYENYQGGPRVNWRPGKTTGWHFAGITGMKSVISPDGSVTDTYTFSNLIAYENNVIAGYASGTYVRTVYEVRNVWYVNSAQLNAEVFAQPQ